ncbi:Cellulose synthase [Dillenia turbinata]|uniref:Cellulose synthase n=1 Tax=Dillenia turbinata TaxID=194707 RepID=A0AAN8WE90_9MAGN
MGRGEALFETKRAKGREVYKVFSSTIFVGICLIWFYRLKNILGREEEEEEIGGRWAWIGMFGTELWFGLYWIITQSVRWSTVYRYPFKDRLFLRFEDKLPGIDIFVCTADPTMEPPTLVINTILSVMAYNYPSEKLSVYLSDDGCSDLTFYALIEASRFSKHWIPFCKKFKVEPRSPQVFFDQCSNPEDNVDLQEWVAIKELYEDMKMRIESVITRVAIPEEVKSQHKGFSEWNSEVTKGNHQPIVQILIDGRDSNAVDNDGFRLPTLVYLAREKRPHRLHHFKAGAMNALIRVSSEISNGPIILNVDCDMYSNNAETIREVLCFFMDEERGHQTSYVQFPQNYNNLTKHDIYSNSYRVVNKIEQCGIDGYDAALYCGTGCFHRRESLCGRKYTEDFKEDWNFENRRNMNRTVSELEEASKIVATCSYEDGTKWGKEMGLVYGCAVEDIITGLTIQCRGWKPIYYNPEPSAFLGVAPNTLEQALIQHKRWSEGMFQIFFSKYCPFFYGHGKIKFGAQMGYCIYLLWAPNSFPTHYYLIIPSLCLLHGIPLFPKLSSPWVLPFAYVFLAKYAYSLVEGLSCGETIKSWWNLQRTWMIRRTTSYLFAFMDTIIKQLGLSQTTFVITSKVLDDGALKRYEQEIFEFGSSSSMFTILATLAMLNLFTLFGGIMKLALDMQGGRLEQLVLQIILNALIVMVNIPIYQALFFRSDKGKLPSSVLLLSVFLASMACLMPIY